MSRVVTQPIPGSLRARLDAQIASALDHARVSDPLGHQIHTVLAMVYLFTLPLFTAGEGISFGLLFLWTCIRLPRTWRSSAEGWREPMLWAMLAWAAWMLMSFAWSTDRHQAFDELGACRALLTPLLIWPVIDRLPWLIAATLAGVAAQNIEQLLQALGWLNWRPQEGEGRYGGFIHPIQTGAWCVAAMCWQLSAALHSKGKVRWISVIGLMMATAGLIATESRGPWLAAAISLPLMLVFILIRRPQLRRAAALLIVLGSVAMLAAWPIVKTSITSRITAAADEARLARDQHIYGTSVGSRIGMNRWAWAMFTGHPIIGIGAGSYPKAQKADADYQSGLEQTRTASERLFMTKQHPHSTYLYALACTGLVGALILLILLALALRQCIVDRPDHLYADGTLFVLVSWIIGAAFECYNLNGHHLGMLAFVLTITLPHRAAIRCVWNPRDDAVADARQAPAAALGSEKRLVAP